MSERIRWTQLDGGDWIGERPGGDPLLITAEEHEHMRWGSDGGPDPDANDPPEHDVIELNER